MNLFPSFVVDKRKFYAQNSTHLFLIVPKTGRRIHVNSNSVHTLLLGLCLGITLGIAIIPLFELDCNSEFSIEIKTNPVSQQNSHVLKVIPEQSDVMQPSRGKMLRPRFYSTELGLRKKLLAGIILTDYTDQSHLIAINRTLGPFVDQLLFFVVGQVTSQKVRSLLGISAVVTLTSKRNEYTAASSTLKLNTSQSNQVGLRAIKYLGDKFSNDYNFFFLSLDTFYINGIILHDSVNQFSVSQDMLWGFRGGNSDACNLENGLVFSRSVLRKLSSRLDRCLVSTVLKQGDSMKNCYQYSFGSLQIKCSDIFQAQVFITVSTQNVHKYYSAVAIGPVESASEMYWIHVMISKWREQTIEEKIMNISKELNEMMHKVPEGYQTNSWPPGIQSPHRPQSRFDVLKWKFFTTTHLYPQDDHITDVSLTGIEKMDVSIVINNSAQYLSQIKHQSLESFSFQYGYKRFDETRGMEYILDFLDPFGSLLRVEGLRPISKVEMVSLPFVTEVRRVTIVVPIISLDLYNETHAFLKNYMNAADTKSNSVVVIAIIIPDGTLSPLDLIKLQNYKRLISMHNSNHNKGVSDTVDSIRVGHAIVNLKQFKASHYALAVFDMLSNQILSSNTLVLVLDLFIEIKDEFLNRVRMNTILNYQVFSPMPFFEYDPQVYGRDYNNNKSLEINKVTGYFDRDSFSLISFFIGDYVSARKQLSLSSRSLNKPTSRPTSHPMSENGVRRLSQLFLEGSQLHFLRAPEPSVIVRFEDNTNLYPNCSQKAGCLWRKRGSKASLAKLILNSFHPSENRSL